MSGQHEPPRSGAHCGDATVYLLGLLDERRSKAFLDHARDCALCNDDLAALAPAVDSLPGTVPQLAAPVEVKRQVMTVVRREANQAHREAMQARRSSSGSGWARWRAARRRPALALAAAGLLGVGIAIGALSTPFRAGPTPGGGGTAARVVNATVELAGASATLHQSTGHTWLTVARMPEPSSGHVYEVWLKRPGAALPQPTTSLFIPAASGEARVDVPVAQGAGTVMVTQEPIGGSSLPTGRVLIVAHMRQ